jgi:hypothetical protein
MNGKTEIERALDGFFADGPERVADQAFLRALDAIDRTKQRRDLLAPWRLSLMSINSRLATMMVVALVAVGGATYLLGQRSSIGGPVPTPTVSPSPGPTAVAVAPSATPDMDTTGWIPFTSALYGFTVSHPPAWTLLVPATGRWSYSTQSNADEDVLFSPSGWPEFDGWETRIPAGMTLASFLTAMTADAVQNMCYPGPSQLLHVTVSGRPATVAYYGCNEHFYVAQAVVMIGNRVWFFDLVGPDRSLILPFLSTVTIDPTLVHD